MSMMVVSSGRWSMYRLQAIGSHESQSWIEIVVCMYSCFVYSVLSRL